MPALWIIRVENDPSVVPVSSVNCQIELIATVERNAYCEKDLRSLSIGCDGVLANELCLSRVFR